MPESANAVRDCFAAPPLGHGTLEFSMDPVLLAAVGVDDASQMEFGTDIVFTSQKALLLRLTHLLLVGVLRAEAYQTGLRSPHRILRITRHSTARSAGRISRHAVTTALQNYYVVPTPFLHDQMTFGLPVAPLTRLHSYSVHLLTGGLRILPLRLCHTLSSRPRPPRPNSYSSTCSSMHSRRPRSARRISRPSSRPRPARRSSSNSSNRPSSKSD